MPTLQLKALNKHNLAHITYIEMANVIRYLRKSHHIQRTKCFQCDRRQTQSVSMKGWGAIKQPHPVHCPANSLCDAAATHLVSSCAASCPAERV